jgi:spore maturation protein CgeB
VADVFRGWLLGLRAQGVETGAYNMDDRLNFFGSAKLERNGQYVPAFESDAVPQMALDGICSELWKHSPVDVALVVSGFYVPPNFMAMMRDRGTKVVLLHTESPYEDDTQVERSADADLVLVNDPTNLDRFRQVNPNTHYQWHCYDPDRHKPGPVDPTAASQFCFVGTGFPSRVEFLEQVDWSGIDVALAGHWATLDPASRLRQYVAHGIEECCDNATTARLYQSTQLSANLYRQEAERPELSAGWAMGPREVELAAIGVPFLRDPRPEGDALFPFLPTFTTPEEFTELLRWHLARPDLTAALGVRAREVIRPRTFANSAARMLRLLETPTDTNP